MALKIYIKARATPKVVAAFAERREFDKILIYSKQVSESFLVFSMVSPILFSHLAFKMKSNVYLLSTHFALLFLFLYSSDDHSMIVLRFLLVLLQVGYTPDYLFLLQTILRSDPQVCHHPSVIVNVTCMPMTCLLCLLYKQILIELTLPSSVFQMYYVPLVLLTEINMTL